MWSKGCSGSTVASPLLELKHVSKRYSLRAERRLRDATADTLRELCGLPARQGLRPGEFWALEDIDLRVDAGEVIGVIGHNGAGKSTLLNLVSGIILPTTGSIELHTDKVCRIDQSGVLSSQETGRENIRMQLALYGVPIAETEAEIRAIAAFADLDRQLDAPVGTYSAGMRGRLGFAIYARLHPELFIVDEGIGGGDRRFRDRFRGFIETYVADGGSMLFCMHDTHLIQSICDRVLVLDGGRAVLTATPTDAIDAYNALAAERGLPPLPARRPRATPRHSPPRAPRSRTADAPRRNGLPAGDRRFEVVGIRIDTAEGGTPRAGGAVEIAFTLRMDVALDEAVAVIEIRRGEIVPLATIHAPLAAITPPGTTMRCRIDCLALVPGEYEVHIGLQDPHSGRLIGDPADGGRSRFRVQPASDAPRTARDRGGLVHLPATWESVPYEETAT